MEDKKLVIHVSHSYPHVVSEFFHALRDIKTLGIDIEKVDKERQEIWTKNVHIRFLTRHTDLYGYRIDEIFGERNQFNECFLKDKKRPRYSGTLAEYVKKLEENAVTDAFLEKELDKIRKE